MARLVNLIILPNVTCEVGKASERISCEIEPEVYIQHINRAEMYGRKTSVGALRPCFSVVIMTDDPLGGVFCPWGGFNQRALHTV